MTTRINEDIVLAIVNYVLTIYCMYEFIRTCSIGYLIGGIICFLLGVFETYVGLFITNEYNWRRK